MSTYTALYRKYRPEKFSDVIGQEHITSTLINQIKLGRVGHAYLFTGSRGVGKTTCARIFARAVNCARGDGEPCGECETCRKLFQPNTLDIIEIDAASNNGVDEARELKERVKYPPVCGKYKVFIIDEAHMLTGGAANALLKTLEEPPSYAIFILATTEAHKLPATILSRCMRFDFRLVELSRLEDLLKKVLSSEGKDYEDEAIRAIALAGEGSVRDCLSVADKCFAASCGKLTYSDVMRLIGVSDEGSIGELFGCLTRSDVSKALSKLSLLIGMGKTPTLIAKELTAYARNVLLIKAAPELVVMPDSRKAALKAVADTVSAAETAAIMEILDRVGGELRLSTDPTITLEIAIFKACRLFGLDVSSLETRVARLEKRFDEGACVMRSPTPDGGVKPVTSAPATEDVSHGTLTEKSEQESSAAANLPDKRVVWGRILTYLRTSGSNIIYSLFASQRDFNFEDGVFTICASDKDFLMLTDDSVQKAFQNAVNALGYDFKLKIISPDAEKERELERIKKLIGDTPIRIIE